MREGIDCNGKKWTEYMKPYLKRYDITGQVFDDLTVLFRVDVNSYQGCALWLCKCICGNEIIVRATDLRSGHTKSCGCTVARRCLKNFNQEINLDGISFFTKNLRQDVAVYTVVAVNAALKRQSRVKSYQMVALFLVGAIHEMKNHNDN